MNAIETPGASRIRISRAGSKRVRLNRLNVSPGCSSIQVFPHQTLQPVRFSGDAVPCDLPAIWSSCGHASHLEEAGKEFWIGSRADFEAVLYSITVGIRKVRVCHERCFDLVGESVVVGIRGSV